MRVVKEAAVRKNEILDAAEYLFGTKGFDKTSTNDILDRVGIARGTLYYHFKSKEEILDAMIGRITGRLVERAGKIAAAKNVPVLQRLTEMMLALHVDNELGQEIMAQIHKPQNALLHQKMQEQLLAGIVPLIAALIEEGIEQGICRTDYPEDAAEMVLLYSNTVFDDLMEYSEEVRRRKMAAFIYHLERVLGMPRDSMRDVILPIFQGERGGYGACHTAGVSADAVSQRSGWCAGGPLRQASAPDGICFSADEHDGEPESSG